MKKTILAILALTVVISSIYSCVLAAQYTKFSTKFIKAFKDCDKYEETVTSEYDNKTFTTTRKISGWHNGSCRYQETIKSPTDSYLLNCSFGELQVDELYQSMKSKDKDSEKYELDLYVEQKDPKTGKTKFVVAGSRTLIGNKAYINWAKYQNNPYFCTPQKL